MTETTKRAAVDPSPEPSKRPSSQDGRSRIRGAWTSHVTEVREHTNNAALEAIGTGDRRASDLTVSTVLLVAAVSLVGIEYLGRTFEPQWFQRLLDGLGFADAADQIGNSILQSPHGKFWGLLFWSAVRIAFYVVVPLTVARLVLGLRPSEIGMRLRGTLVHAWPYVVLFVLAMPVIAVASFGDEFEARYPFYDPLPGEGLWPYLVLWWVVYAAQFVGVEIFFRGFLVLGLAPRMGITAVYVSVVPYVMIHFDKPLPETIGAIAAGVALGHLALKYRSIWWGAALHIAVAVCFDLLALHHQGFFA